MISNYLKIALFGVLRFMPGRLGAKSESRFYWALRKVRLKGTREIFDRHLDALGKDSICIDLGANVGEITEHLLDKAGRVYAFEPDPWAFSRLQERIGKNDKAVLLNKAIGPEDGTLELYRDPTFAEDRQLRSQGTSAFQSESWGEGTPEKFSVEMTDICRFLRELGEPVDILKMDIEGAEVDLLEKLLASPEKAQVRAIFVETHEAQMPQLRDRTRALRARVGKIEQPKIFLNWQ